MCEYDIIRRCRFSSTFILFSLFHIWYNIASIVFPSLLQLCCVPCCNYEYIFLIDLLKPSKKCDKRPGKRRKTRRGKEIVQRKWSNFYNRNPHICMQKIHEEFRANKVTLKQSEVLQISSWESLISRLQKKKTKGINFKRSLDFGYSSWCAKCFIAH